MWIILRNIVAFYHWGRTMNKNHACSESTSRVGRTYQWYFWTDLASLSRNDRLPPPIKYQCLGKEIFTMPHMLYHSMIFFTILPKLFSDPEYQYPDSPLNSWKRCGDISHKSVTFYHWGHALKNYWRYGTALEILDLNNVALCSVYDIITRQLRAKGVIKSDIRIRYPDTKISCF